MPESLLKWVRPEIRDLDAYKVADARGLIKLDAMENPYALDPAATQRWADAVAAASINRYPDPVASGLKKAVKRYMQPPLGTSMIFGNGSDELIQMLAMTVSSPGRCVLSLEPGFVMYRLITEFTGMDYVGVPLKQDAQIDLFTTLQAIAEHQPAVIFIAYPNNPTGNCFRDVDIEEIIKAAPGIVVLDEAYHPFAQKSWLGRLSDYDHLVVMRTVSKLGLAGLRLGVLFGHPLLLGEVDKVRLPYNINVLTQAAATSVIDESDVLEQQAADIREERARMFREFRSIDGVEVFSSDANFILFRLQEKPATEVFESIREQGVLIKNMRANEGLLANCLRVTVGKPEENDAFFAALRSSLGS